MGVKCEDKGAKDVSQVCCGEWRYHLLRWRTVGGIIWGGKWSADYFCACIIWNAYLTSQKLLDIQVWISGRDWSYRYKFGSCQIIEVIYSQKIEFLASDNHRVACIWLTDSCADNNYKLEAWGSDLKQIDTGRVSTLERKELHWMKSMFIQGFFVCFFLRILTGPCNTQWELKQKVAVLLGWDF